MVRNFIISILLLLPFIGVSQGSFMFNQHGNLSAEIDTSTYINFIVESSSLSTDSINMAITTVLKDTLIEFYGNESLYNNKVTLTPQYSERIFGTSYLNKDVINITSSNNIKIVNIIFEDECDNSYYDEPFDTLSFDSEESFYKFDIDSLRSNTENWRNTLRYTGIVFWVDRYRFYDDLGSFLKAIYNGQGVYSGDYGLEDRQEQFMFYYNEDEKLNSDSETRYYYSEKIIGALRDLGFDL